jgi:hypothetical protein
MTATELLDNLVNQLGWIAGLPGLQLDEDGHASLVFNQAVTIHLQARDTENDILLYAAPAALPEENGYAVALKLLRANFLWRDTGGATLSLAGDDEVMLTQKLSIENLDLTAFQERFTTFARTALKWKEQVESPAGEPIAGGAPPLDIKLEEELPAFATRI